MSKFSLAGRSHCTSVTPSTSCATKLHESMKMANTVRTSCSTVPYWHGNGYYGIWLDFRAVSKQNKVTTLFRDKEHVTQCIGVAHCVLEQPQRPTADVYNGNQAFNTHTILLSFFAHGIH